jgi:hypothetical protein
LLAKLLSIQHRSNPLHLYCRLLDIGLSRRLSMSLCKGYEILLFMSLSFIIKNLIHYCLLLNRSSQIQDVLRRGSST